MAARVVCPNYGATTTSTSNDENQAKTIARILAVDIVEYAVDKNSKTRKRYAKTLRRMVERLLQRHSMLFSGMIRKLKINRETSYATFVNVVDEMLTDCHFNWGRLVAIYAFAARLTMHCMTMSMDNNNVSNNSHVVGCFESASADTVDDVVDNGANSNNASGNVTVYSNVRLEDYASDVAKYVGDYVADHLSGWIAHHGGWAEFENYFCERQTTEDGIWQGFLLTAIGLGALATVVAVR